VSDDYWEQFRRRMIEILRSGMANAHVQDMAADELERLWWPKECKRARRRDYEATVLSQERTLIDELAEQYRSQGVKNPRTKAEQDAATKFGYRDMEGLRRRRTRYRGRARD
jgi:hypothetical protein